MNTKAFSLQFNDRSNFELSLMLSSSPSGHPWNKNVRTNLCLGLRLSLLASVEPEAFKLKVKNGHYYVSLEKLSTKSEQND